MGRWIGGVDRWIGDVDRVSAEAWVGNVEADGGVALGRLGPVTLRPVTE